MHFQEYLVRRGAQDKVINVMFEGAEKAQPAPGVIDSILNADIIIICPSNPIVSIGTILSVKNVRNTLRETRARVVAISPIVGGAPIKGPADKLMEGKGVEVSAKGVAEFYREFLDVLVIDQKDKSLAPKIEELGVKAVVEQTLMTSMERKKQLVRTVLAAAKNEKSKS